MAASSRIKGASGRLWEACIGLEVHAQIQIRSKLFSGASAEVVQYGKPNTQVALLDAALPGTLPMINKDAVLQAVRTGIALGCNIRHVSRFERKHYYYCDLPQGYQITQQASPIAVGGAVLIEAPVHENQRRGKSGSTGGGGSSGSNKKRNSSSSAGGQEYWEAANVRINRIQLEQDSGKSMHEASGGGRTLVDLNRAGAALMEIVFEPDLHSAAQAAELVRALQATLRHLGTCDGNMENGSIRCDLNVSVRPALEEEGRDRQAEGKPRPWGARAEIKNVNSIKALRTAAEYEISRQIDSLEKGEALMGETRSFDAITGKTQRMRAKEGTVDYRFFPEPDLPPLVLEDGLVARLRQELPELPQMTRKRLVESYRLSLYQAVVLVGEPGAVVYFEEVARGREAKGVANWICNELFGLLRADGKDRPLSEAPVTAAMLGELLDLLHDQRISIRTAKEVLGVMMERGAKTSVESPADIVKSRGWEQISGESELRALAKTLVADPASSRQLRQYHEGKGQMLKYFVGQAMKATQGRAHPEKMEALLKEELAALGPPPSPSRKR